MRKEEGAQGRGSECVTSSGSGPETKANISSGNTSKSIKLPVNDISAHTNRLVRIFIISVYIAATKSAAHLSQVAG